MKLIPNLPMPRLIFNSFVVRDKFIWENCAYTNSWYAMILNKGRFSVTMEGREQLARENDIVIFPRGVQFSRKVQKPIDSLYISFDWDVDDKELKNILWPCGVLDFPERARVDADTEMLRRLCNIDTELSQHYFSDIIFEFARLRGEDSIFDYSGISDKAIVEAIRIINLDYAKPLRISELARRLGMSHVSFTNRFNKAAKQKPVAYLASVRLYHACILLDTTDLTVAEVADRCGFENQFYFSRCFAKKYGLPPSGWRSRIKV